VRAEKIHGEEKVQVHFGLNIDSCGSWGSHHYGSYL